MQTFLASALSLVAISCSAPQNGSSATLSLQETAAAKRVLRGSEDPDDIDLALRGSYRVIGTLGQQTDAELRELAATPAQDSADPQSRIRREDKRMIERASLTTLVEQGRRLHEELLREAGAVEQPKWAGLWGSLGDNTLAIIQVPQQEWNQLKEDKRRLLMHYAASRIEEVRRNPNAYMGLSRMAPASPLVLKNIQRMNSRSWGILVGRVNSEGLVLADDIAVSGQEIYIEKLHADDL